MGDIRITAAFGVDERKVGKDVCEAIWVQPNNTIEFARVSHMDIQVHRGMVHDGLGRYLRERIIEDHGSPANVAEILRPRFCRKRRESSEGGLASGAQRA